MVYQPNRLLSVIIISLFCFLFIRYCSISFELINFLLFQWVYFIHDMRDIHYIIFATPINNRLLLFRGGNIMETADRRLRNGCRGYHCSFFIVFLFFCVYLYVGRSFFMKFPHPQNLFVWSRFYSCFYTCSPSGQNCQKTDCRSAFLLIWHSKYHVVKNTLLQTAFSAIFTHANVS